jgi:UDP-N-acetylglucosamine 2-epimerase (non-hydrolysing)
MDYDILHVVGARPNFAKMAPVYKSLSKLRVSQKILHSGQHYDKNMSGDFFKDLGIPDPDITLKIKGKTHAEQTSDVMIGIEKELSKSLPKIVCVYGDINTTLAATISSKKMNTKVAHIESGLRSGDIHMPEEQNRIMVDAISDFHFVTEKSGVDHLKEAGKTASVYHVGNTMIDSLSEYLRQNPRKKSEKYGVATFHRPSNVDSKEGILEVLSILEGINIKTYWPMHPRTMSSLKKFRCLSRAKRIKNLSMIEPLPYNSFINLVNNSTMVITDSGGIQEETTYMGIPCITYRSSTERPATITTGSNVLTMNKHEILNYTKDIMLGTFKKGKIPHLWDGRSGERIALILKRKLL